MQHCCYSGTVQTWMSEELMTGLPCTWQWTVDSSRLLAYSSSGVRASMREIRATGPHSTQPFMIHQAVSMKHISTWCSIYWSTVRTWTPGLTQNTRLPYIWRHTTEGSRLHSYCLTVV